MESDTRTDPDRALERSGDEFEDRLERVEGHIDEARAEAADQRDHTQSIEAAAERGDDEDDDGVAPDEFDDPDAEDEEDEDEDEDEE